MLRKCVGSHVKCTTLTKLCRYAAAMPFPRSLVEELHDGLLSRFVLVDTHHSTSELPQLLWQPPGCCKAEAFTWAVIDNGWLINMGVSHNREPPKWLINAYKWLKQNDLGAPPFLESPICSIVVTSFHVSWLRPWLMDHDNLQTKEVFGTKWMDKMDASRDFRQKEDG